MVCFMKQKIAELRTGALTWSDADFADLRSDHEGPGNSPR
jgi:hypothetical protein